MRRPDYQSLANPPRQGGPPSPSGPMSAYQTGPQPVRPTGPMPRYPGGSRLGSGPVPQAEGGPMPQAGSGPMPRHRTGPMPRHRTGSQPTVRTGPQPATQSRPQPATQSGARPAQGTASRRVTRPILPGLVLALIVVGAAAVVALWWEDTTSIQGMGSVLTNAGRILGLLSGYGFVVLVALMARLPPLERGIGSDRLARWHAMGGRYVITLVTGHVLTIVWGYAVTAHESVISESGTLLTSYPDVLMATASWFLLLGIAAVSARAARRRLRYETWYFVHLYTYLAIALAFSHQFADGQEFAINPQARIAWSALYITVAAAIVWFRVVTPLLRAARHKFTVEGVRAEGDGIVSVYISGRDFRKLNAEPGQFFRWRFLTRDMWWQSHPYSLSAMPSGDLMRITVKARGDHSAAVARLPKGTRVVAEGPYGAFTPALTNRKILLIAGGVGITPIRSMFAALPKRMSDGITLIYRASNPRDIVFRRELDAIAADRGATVHYVIGSRAELGYDPLSAQSLRDGVPGLRRYEAYVCGPPGMTKAAIASLRACGIRRHHIHHESFDF